MFTDDQFNLLLPLACAWAKEQEEMILLKGVPLSPAQISDAKTVGVAHPEKVRLLKVAAIPMPLASVLRQAAKATRLITRDSAGVAFQYGIFIRTDLWADRRLIFHELVHTMQYERMGGIQQFLQEYLTECVKIGYPNGPMEQEAVQTTDQLCPGS